MPFPERGRSAIWNRNCPASVCDPCRERKQVIEECKNEYSDADIAVHVEEGHIELTEVGRFHHGVFIKQKTGGYYNSQEIDAA